MGFLAYVRVFNRSQPPPFCFESSYLPFLSSLIIILNFLILINYHIKSDRTIVKYLRLQCCFNKKETNPSAALQNFAASELCQEFSNAHICWNTIPALHSLYTHLNKSTRQFYYRDPILIYLNTIDIKNNFDGTTMFFYVTCITFDDT